MATEKWKIADAPDGSSLYLALDGAYWPLRSTNATARITLSREHDGQGTVIAAVTITEAELQVIDEHLHGYIQRWEA